MFEHFKELADTYVEPPNTYSTEIFTIHQIADVVAQIAPNYEVTKVYLFGSYARGEATERSDVDLLLEVTDDFSPIDVCGVLEEVLEALNKPVDTYCEREFKEGSEVLKEILKDRVLIHKFIAEE